MIEHYLGNGMVPGHRCMFEEYLPLVGVVIGGVLAIIGGFLSNVIPEVYRNRRESRQLALALRGELEALSHIAKRRQYVESLKNMIAIMEKKREPLFVNIQVRHDYFKIYNNNADKIGVLREPLPEYVARVYVQANSILEDLQSYREGLYASASVDSVIASYKELVELMEDTYALADEIVELITEVY